ncbi:4-hydroxybenzoate octaprenyltransferase [Neptuniibacter caesariensis]|uniref:4-hydroxybenzoate octaprenyltransferase n=1 Tax=Neptuniibacter caesariensis TaxID=207954 RepID=A0A7U8C761_NEPCE|nr:4-hydroxybenzoate octaprenyltransferase [Neptuniibacter caesariensis]EAR62519.1 4-hydroxybenzoate polyprenyl transferase [Oceanospirillum sp. MED92] [Neptuniibacter caesariensis]
MESSAQPSSLSLMKKAKAYGRLMRVEKPIGTYLLLWPAYWALWIAAEGIPPYDILFIFTLGVFLTRSAGCVINDFADRKIDGHVKRTALRPIPAGLVTAKEALILFAGLMLIAFVLVLFTNLNTILLSAGGLLLAACYPFMKRYTHLPQVVLGAAFAWSIPMAFTAVTDSVPLYAWLIYIATLLWTVAYDTMYAMVDRDDDLKIGVKSTAILFGYADKFIIGILQLSTLLSLILLALQVNLGLFFYLGLAGAALLFIYQQWLIRDRERDPCFKAFLNNHYAGLLIFVGLAADYAF